MAEPGWATIATIDEVHLDVVRELMEDAAIPVRFEPVKPQLQADVPPIVARPMCAVEVEAARRAEAEALLADFSQTGEHAAETEAEASRPVDDAAGPGGPLWRRALRWLAGSDDTRTTATGDKDDGAHS